MKFFTPKDFEGQSKGVFGYIIGEGTAKFVSDLANDKLQKEGIVIYGKMNQHGKLDELGQRLLEHTDTHKGLLINVEPFEVCTHPPEKVTELEASRTGANYYMCGCGVEVIPVAYAERP